MTDNVTIYPGATGTAFGVAADKATYSGDADQVAQIVQLGTTTGAEGSRVLVKLPADTTYGLGVDVLRMPAGGASEATLDEVLKEGADITGASMPAGGASGRGWLSAIWKALTDRLPATLVSGRLDVNVGSGSIGVTGSVATTSADGANAALGTTTDADASGNGSLIAILKRLRTLLNGGLPAALGAGGGLKVDGSGTALPVSFGASESHLGEMGGRTITIGAEFTRPADTTAYAPKDAVSDSTSAPTVLTFTDLARINGGSGYMTKVRVVTNQSANNATFRLWLFNAAPTAINDNAAFTLLWTNRATRLGYIDIGPLSTEGTGSDSAEGQNDTARLAFVAGGATRHLYGLLESLSSFTPASAQQFRVELSAELN